MIPKNKINIKIEDTLLLLASYAMVLTPKSRGTFLCFECYLKRSPNNWGSLKYRQIFVHDHKNKTIQNVLEKMDVVCNSLLLKGTFIHSESGTGLHWPKPHYQQGGTTLLLRMHSQIQLEVTF